MLTEAICKNAKSIEKDYKLADSGGLFLLIKANGSKLWQQKYRYLGKTKLLSFGPYIFRPVPDVWIFDGGEIGNFGVAICYDLLDLDRLAMYRGKIQHLFVLSYNKDITSFDHAAEAMARMIFCNVTICNCGYFGGSLSVSPYREPYRRTIYRHAGAKLAAAQLITLPVRPLIEHQKKEGLLFKNLPPGYRGSISHQPRKGKV